MTPLELADEIAAIIGPENTLTGDQTTPYGRDFLGEHVAHPALVARPGSTQEVARILHLAASHMVPVVPIGGNTGLVGGTFAPEGLMISLERMNRIREVRADSRLAIVEAGVILGNLHDALAPQGLTFPLYFGARGSATIGGALSTNAGGANVLRHGNSRALCLGVEVVLSDGRVLDLMSQLHKDNSGYDLKDLFIGAEGTLGIITAAVLKLVPLPHARATAMLACPSLAGALSLLNQLQETSGNLVEAFEFMPRSYMRRMAIARPDLVPPLGHEREVTILLELAATAPRDAAPREDGSIPLQSLLEELLAEAIEAGQAEDAVIARSEAEREKMWHMREIAAELAMSRRPHVDFDVALPLDRVAEFLERADEVLEGIDPGAEGIAVGHLGDGNIHYAVWPSDTSEKTRTRIREEIDALSISLGGSFSAEHGIGLSKLAPMRRHKDPVALSVMREIRQALDPAGIMNPGKVLP